MQELITMAEEMMQEWLTTRSETTARKIISLLGHSQECYWEKGLRPLHKNFINEYFADLSKKTDLWHEKPNDELGLEILDAFSNFAESFVYLAWESISGGEMWVREWVRTVFEIDERIDDSLPPSRAWIRALKSNLQNNYQNSKEIDPLFSAIVQREWTEDELERILGWCIDYYLNGDCDEAPEDDEESWYLGACRMLYWLAKFEQDALSLTSLQSYAFQGFVGLDSVLFDSAQQQNFPAAVACRTILFRERFLEDKSSFAEFATYLRAWSFVGVDDLDVSEEKRDLLHQVHEKQLEYCKSTMSSLKHLGNLLRGAEGRTLSKSILKEANIALHMTPLLAEMAKYIIRGDIEVEAVKFLGEFIKEIKILFETCQDRFPEVFSDYRSTYQGRWTDEFIPNVLKKMNPVLLECTNEDEFLAWLRTYFMESDTSIAPADDSRIDAPPSSSLLAEFNIPPNASLKDILVMLNDERLRADLAEEENEKYRAARNIERDELSEAIGRDYEVKYGSAGYTFNRIFGPYLEGANIIEVFEPYLQRPYQMANLSWFCKFALDKGFKGKMVIHTCRGIREKFESSYSCDEDLKILEHELVERGVEASYKIEGIFHDRKVVFDNGWVVRLGRGLHIYQPPKSFSTLGAIDFNRRLCVDFSVTIIRKEPE